VPTDKQSQGNRNAPKVERTQQLDAQDAVRHLELLQHVEAVDQAAEVGVAPIEVRRLP
jgi:hypothetical protein